MIFHDLGIEIVSFPKKGGSFHIFFVLPEGIKKKNMNSSLGNNGIPIISYYTAMLTYDWARYGIFLVVRICFKSMRLNKFIHEGGTDFTHSVDEFVPRIDDCLPAMYGKLNARNSYNAVEGGFSYFKQILSKSYLVSLSWVLISIDIHTWPGFPDAHL